MATKQKGIVADVVEGVEAGVEKLVGSKKKAKKAKAAPTSTPNPSAVDSRGRTFDKTLHAAHTDGKPMTDSTGAFVAKDAAYKAPRQAHYSDSYRHEAAATPEPPAETAAPAARAKKSKKRSHSKKAE